MVAEAKAAEAEAEGPNNPGLFSFSNSQFITSRNFSFVNFVLSVVKQKTTFKTPQFFNQLRDLCVLQSILGLR